MHRRALVWVASLAVLPIMLLAAWGCGGGSPSDAVEELLKASQARDCEKIVNLVDYSQLEARGQTINREELVRLCRENPEPAEIIGYNIIEETVDGDAAEVRVEVTIRQAGQEATQTEAFPLTKKDGEWRVTP